MAESANRRLQRRILLGLALILAPTPALAGGPPVGGVAASMMAADFDPSMMELHRRWTPLRPGQATVHLQSPPMPLESLIVLMYSIETGRWSRAGMRRVTLTRTEADPNLLVLDAVLDLPRGELPSRGLDTAQVIGILEALAATLATAPERMTLLEVELREASIEVNLIGEDALAARDAIQRIEAAAAFDEVRPVRLQEGSDRLAVRLKAELIEEEEAVAVVE